MLSHYSGSLLAEDSMANQDAGKQLRQQSLFDDGWKFLLEDIPQGESEKVDDRHWWSARRF
jgi:hypothetical protein